MLSDPQLHYLDNAATSRVDPAVAQAVSEALTELWANPSSLYDPAVAVQDAIAAARARVAKTLHCRSDEIYFTACGSEGNNMAVTGAARPRKHWGNKIVVTGFEHPSVQRPIRALKDEGFTVVEVMPGADGRIDTQKFLAEIDKNTVLAACMAVNNETGTALAEDVAPGDYTLAVQPIEGYTQPEAQTVTVKEKVVYKADVKAVKEKIVQASQVNESAEDSGVSNAGSAPIVNEVTDTVTYADSAKTETGSKTSYTAKLSSSCLLYTSPSPRDRG